MTLTNTLLKKYVPNGTSSNNLLYVSKLKLFGKERGFIKISALGLKDDNTINTMGYKLIVANAKAMI